MLNGYKASPNGGFARFPRSRPLGAERIFSSYHVRFIVTRLPPTLARLFLNAATAASCAPLHLVPFSLPPNPLAHALSLHLPVKWRSFLLVVIKSKVGVFESSSGCQRALDVPLMASPPLSCLPTAPVTVHQPITTVRQRGPQNTPFFLECA